MMKLYNRTKIIATLGPASDQKDILRSMIQTGVDVVRLNFSHGTHADKAKLIAIIHELNLELESNVGIMADLQGPKIRLGRIEGDSFEIKKGDKLKITTEEKPGNKYEVSISYPQFPADVQSGDKILIDDGKLEMLVIESDGIQNVLVEALQDGIISSNKGVNLPDTEVSLPSLTEKDLEDLRFILTQEVDWIALSFVRKPEDILDIKEKIADSLPNEDPNHLPKIIAKIEKPQAVRNIEAILDVTDAVMIARGDLGVEMPMEEVPRIQKAIVKKCIKHAKPVIIATQMMESMITSPKPTRAEVADVANAIYDGADAVMLSAETAMGKYPTRVVDMMMRIIKEVEEDQIIYNKHLVANPESPTYLSDAICYNAGELATKVGAYAIIGMTRSGYTAYMVSSFRPSSRIFVFTDNKRLLNRLSLVWGVKASYYDGMVGTEETFQDVHQMMKEKGYLHSGDITVNMASMPLHRQGRTNMIKLSKIE